MSAPAASVTRRWPPPPRLLAGCAAGPDYRKPEVEVPVSLAARSSPGAQAAPGDAEAKGAVVAALRRCAARRPAGEGAGRQPDPRPRRAPGWRRRAPPWRRRRACSRSWAWVRAPRAKISANRPLTNYARQNFSTVQNDFALPWSPATKLDLAGRVQRTVEGASASAAQSAADLENTRLLLTADLATAYFSLRATRPRTRRGGALDRGAAPGAAVRDRPP